MKIDAVIFDLDGVLLDTEYHQWKGWNHAFKHFELDIELTKSQYLKYAGKRGDVIESELMNDFNLDIREGALVNAKEEELLRWFREESLEPMHFVHEAIDFVESNPRLKIGLASGGPRPEVILKLRRAGLEKYFPVFITGSDVDVGKPNPEIYRNICAELNVDPSNALSFEDTQYGLWAAKDAGMYCLAIPTEYSDKQDFSRADEQFSNLEEAINWLSSVISE
ncbi:MAG: HAD family phosphatase [Candidatus Saccharimonadales bacterium]|nr:HAD family phosphatase [Candidatus Saccharimonadales bacterium]